MAISTGAPGEAAVDTCADLRIEVASRCEEAHAAAEAYAAASEEARACKRDLVACQHQVEAAVAAADPGLRRADKAAAYDTYLAAHRAATTDAQRIEATAAWAAAIDRVNRQGRLASRNLTRTRGQAATAEEALRAAQQAEQALRFKAEAAQEACLDGRVRLAACDERLAVPARAPVSALEPGARPDGRTAVVRLGASMGAQPLVIESVLAGDAEAFELAALSVAERAVLSPAEARLQLRELVDAVVAAASHDGFLVFDLAHPLWSQLSPEESRDVVGALARLGFSLEPLEGWHNGRQPSGSDLSMALGYAGLDTRQMRNLPGTTDLAGLPSSIGVDPQAFLAAQAPDLDCRLLGRLGEVRMVRQGGQLQRERRADVEGGGGLRRAVQVEAPDDVRRQPLGGRKPGKGHGTTRRLHGIERGVATGAHVRVQEAAVRLDDSARVGRAQGVGPERADEPHELLTQGQVVGHGTLRPMEEGDAGVSQPRGGGALGTLAARSDLERIGRSVIPAGVAT
jgi:hypothetical protein